MHELNFPAPQQYSLVSRVWGNSIDNGISGKKFSATINGQTAVATIAYACKFAYYAFK